MGADEELVAQCRKYRKNCETGLITPAEFVSALFDQFAIDKTGLTRLAPDILVVVPQVAAKLFAQRVGEVLEAG
ncbi:MAG TPA: hypothetical protein VE988_21445, partial [Gemmataceae bacterium]|nr:hypothetical protein [Gemmataceae bacterium]